MDVLNPTARRAVPLVTPPRPPHAVTAQIVNPHPQRLQELSAPLSRAAVAGRRRVPAVSLKNIIGSLIRSKVLTIQLHAKNSHAACPHAIPALVGSGIE